MMMFLKSINTKVLLFIVVLVAGFFYMDRVKVNAERDLMKDQKIEQIEQEISIRKKVDTVLQQNRKENPNREGSIALEKLKKQYGRE